ncbi:MAG: phosphoribosylformylglycinamidine cyclo-ligase [Thermacetogeniaceae bacterium]|jgi:phosphoribosylformylglycinamidine cyclo-ligase
MTGKKDAYREAGVDIDAGNRAMEMIRAHAASTMRPEVLAGVGGFSGLFALDTARYRQPVLVSGTDGVGTKLRVAQLAGKHDTVGIDLVAMCVNDILVCGAEPLFFLDYLACGKLVPEQVTEIVRGVAAGCREAGCALIGGETAEMPGFYRLGEYDLAGFAVGVVERDAVWDGSRIREGDVLLGLASSGLHSNGFSLARRVLFEQRGWTAGTFLPAVPDLVEPVRRTLGEELLTPTRIYVKSVLALRDRFVAAPVVKGAAHITGGGIIENLPRVLPDGLGAVVRRGSWPVPPVFRLIQEEDGTRSISDEEMYRVFNMGIGMVLIVAGEAVDDAAATLSDMGEQVYEIGEVRPGQGVTFIDG